MKRLMEYKISDQDNEKEGTSSYGGEREIQRKKRGGRITARILKQ